MPLLLVDLVAQDPPFGTASHPVLRRQCGAQPGANACPREFGKALVEGAKIVDALFVFGGDEAADDRLFINHRV
ncbi:MAG: hypothetical protein AW09_004386 [Candidatus Accumulibacter phosphatis]|uniref:Uncharacterized protein n=1 Tax=Candidatus Accumulibacter phosphatis TaxID=327160 RepID=A0A084Y719_9PROT|nr:MAG: hypothetical protein AW09_004386 [Candidatus Accumulibacter phosphatis]